MNKNSLSYKIRSGFPIIKDLNKALLVRYHKKWTKKIIRESNKDIWRIVGMRRSGNHAIINWLMSQNECFVHFCNDVRTNRHPITALTKETRNKSAFSGSLKKKFIYSFENTRVSAIESYPTELSWEGNSINKKTIVIIRDPFNLFASMFMRDNWQGELMRSDENYRKEIVSIWKENVKTCIDKKDSEKFLCINYNLWATSKEYRQSLCTFLKIPFNDNGFREKPDYGGGSSTLNAVLSKEQTGKTSVLTRWESYMDNTVFRSIFTDPEIIELGNVFFEKETDQWLQITSGIEG